MVDIFSFLTRFLQQSRQWSSLCIAYHWRYHMVCGPVYWQSSILQHAIWISFHRLSIQYLTLSVQLAWQAQVPSKADKGSGKPRKAKNPFSVCCESNVSCPTCRHSWRLRPDQPGHSEPDLKQQKHRPVCSRLGQMLKSNDVTWQCTQTIPRNLLQAWLKTAWLHPAASCTTHGHISHIW